MLNAQKIIDKITTEQVIRLCCDLQGTNTYLTDSYGNPIFNTCLDHNGGKSYKLYYFADSHRFYVFTTGEGYDIFELVKRAKGFSSFKESYDFIVNYFHFKNTIYGFDEDTFGVEDISIERIPQKKVKLDREINENILEFFYPLASPTEWEKEGISTEVMNFYGIRCDSANQKIIIPQRDCNGKLVGIRGRSFNPIDIDNGRKYMPIKIENDLYNCPLGNHLFGLNYNRKGISKANKVLIVEGEKSVLQMSTFYSLDLCYAVATCGFNISDEQIDLLLSLGVPDVIVGFDRDFHGTGDDSDVLEYEKKLLKVVKPLLAYFNVYILIDKKEHLLPYKASPTDCGQLTYRKLLAQKIHITEDMYK